jgi:hypothetical protein
MVGQVAVSWYNHEEAQEDRVTDLGWNRVDTLVHQVSAIDENIFLFAAFFFVCYLTM